MDSDAKDVRFLKGLFSLIPGTPASRWHKVINKLREPGERYTLMGSRKIDARFPIDQVSKPA